MVDNNTAWTNLMDISHARLTFIKGGICKRCCLSLLWRDALLNAESFPLANGGSGEHQSEEKELLLIADWRLPMGVAPTQTFSLEIKCNIKVKSHLRSKY